MASRFRNRTALFILAIWTLIDCVAPDQDGGDDDNYDVKAYSIYEYIQLFTPDVVDDDDDQDIILYHIIMMIFHLK